MYHGTSAESEPETQNTANYFRLKVFLFFLNLAASAFIQFFSHRSSGNIVGAIDWHSYSQLILRPYGIQSIAEHFPLTYTVTVLSEYFQYTHKHIHSQTGWTYDNSPDEAQLKALGDDMKRAIFAVHRKRYTSQKSTGLYKTTGFASDW